MISRSILLSLAVVALFPACRGDDHAMPDADAPPTLAELAVGWSGGQPSPRCQDSGPRGEYLGGMGNQYCEWVAPDGSGVVGKVSANADLRGKPTLLMWERPTRDAADADRIIDSLGTALTGEGLVRRECGTDSTPPSEVHGFIWEGPGLVVLMTRITPESGVPRLMAMAVDVPSAVPDVACPRSQPS